VATHVVTNQPPPLVGHDAWAGNPVLRAAVDREGGGWIAPQAAALAQAIGSEAMQLAAAQANRFTPELRTHDRFGHRIDSVEFHPAYHTLMGTAFGAGLHALAWTAGREGAFVARAALNHLWNGFEQGIACPVTMSFAAGRMLDHAPALARAWQPKLFAADYDPRPLPVAQKRAVTIGMAMTEKQGGSDLRSNATTAEPAGDGMHRLTGHKWFCSAPMSDAFFTLARTPSGLSCFLVPRALPDGARNPFAIQRLKDKCGNRSNASAEVEYDGTLAWRVGDEGRGIPTIIEMAHLTRFDIVIANAGFMRGMFDQALHHARHRSAFGRVLSEQPLMQAVLADLAIECEAATLVAMRLARAFDRGPADAHEAGIARLLTPIAKYWSCKRTPAVAVEAMECLGGSGYVEDGPMARYWREAPLNGIWEGSGNVICLDVLRTMQREPAALAALLHEIDRAAANDARLATHAASTRQLLADQAALERNARTIVERLAREMQASLVIAHAPAMVYDAFCATRIGDDGGRVLGALPAWTRADAIVERAG